MNRIFNIIIISLIFFQGCSVFKPKERLPKAIVVTKRVVNPQKLSAGGSIAIIPFKAGANVAATPDLDRISLMLIKGIADELDQDSRFTFLLGDSANQADFIIQGHITTVDEARSVVTLRKSFEVGVKGQMIDRYSGEVICLFDEKKAMNNKGLTHQQVAFILGQDLGAFLVGSN